MLYLDRYWQQEQQVRRELDERAARPAAPVDLVPLPTLFGGPAPDLQRLATAVVAGRWVSVITGGPGTGKTHTVARLLLDQPGRPRASRWPRPGDARGGMATRNEAEQALGLRQLRAGRAVIRPDRYGSGADRRRRTEPGR